MATDQDMLNDLSADDTADAPPPDKTARILKRLTAANFFAGKIATRMSKVEQFLSQGPPITPEIRTALAALQTSATNIAATATRILAAGGSQ